MQNSTVVVAWDPASNRGTAALPDGSSELPCIRKEGRKEGRIVTKEGREKRRKEIKKAGHEGRREGGEITASVLLPPLPLALRSTIPAE
jgi:hypothetical protein